MTTISGNFIAAAATLKSRLKASNEIDVKIEQTGDVTIVKFYKEQAETNFQQLMAKVGRSDASIFQRMSIVKNTAQPVADPSLVSRYLMLPNYENGKFFGIGRSLLGGQNALEFFVGKLPEEGFRSVTNDSKNALRVTFADENKDENADEDSATPVAETFMTDVYFV